MNDGRPDPDRLLQGLQEQEQQARRGRLTIFFGAAPGVGKTYAMLEAARAERAQGRRVLAGVVETHGRAETAALLEGLEILPRRESDYRDIRLSEFDLDAALARRPDLLLVDELAHTNVPGARHPKRWQDVEEVLDAGIDVFGTLNVQHLESLNDVVARLSGVVVRETVPDSLLERAHEIRLVDLPPDELRQRLAEGKVYVSDQAALAVQHFFRKENLIALRELALRRTAEQVDRQMEDYRRRHGIEHAWSTSDRLLVCVSPSPYSAHLVRAASRMARGLHIPWFALYVETPASRRLPEADQARVAAHLRLAGRLGAEVAAVGGERTAAAVLAFAREHHVSKIIVGKPRVLRLRDRIRGSFVDEIIRDSGDIDVFATSGEEEGAAEGPSVAAVRTGVASPREYLAAAAIVVASASLGWLAFGQEGTADVIMVLLLGVVVASLRLGYGPSLVAAALSALAFDFFFVPPYLSFSIQDFSHVMTFGVLFLVAIVISHLARRARDQAEAARDRERRTAVLYAVTRELARTTGLEALVAVASAELAKVFDCEVAVFTPAVGGDLRTVHRIGVERPSEDEASIARWALNHVRDAGLGTDTLPGARGLYLPLVATRGPVGVIGLIPRDPNRFRDVERRRLLDALAGQMAMAMERALLVEEAQQVRVEAEREQLRNTLLSSVSHDLRTPLATITGAASTLVGDGEELEPAARRELAQSICDEAERLNRRVRDLLDMTRLESRAVQLRLEWQPVEEVVGAALARMERPLAGRDVTARLDPDLPLVAFDAVLIEQVLVNLLENAVKYSPPGTPIQVSACVTPGEVVVSVADRGPGIPPGQEDRVFQKFYRAPETGRGDGVGLGLAVCRAALDAHGGRIWVDNTPGGGAAFRFALPVRGTPPAMDVPQAEEDAP
jgi:two-component system sensor histidine kinase KdpD